MKLASLKKKRASDKIMSIELSTTVEQGVTILTVSGRIDHATADIFQKDLLEAIGQDVPVLVDMAGVEYISSLGLRSFMIAAKQQKAGFGTTNLTEPVNEIFTISRFDMVVKNHASTADGIEALSSAS